MTRVLTGIIFLLCITVGALGFKLYAGRLPPPSPEAPSVKARTASEEEKISNQAIQKIKSQLNDPDSLQIKDTRIVIVRGPGTETVRTLCGFYNAKNSFGGYVGFMPFVYIIDHVGATTSVRASQSLQLFKGNGAHQDFNRLCDADGNVRSADDLNLLDIDLP